MTDYKQYEQDCERIQAANKQLLTDFEAWLKESGLAAKTIRNHSNNVDLYINHYLLYEEALEAQQGIHEIGMFLGSWFIRKTTWASPAQIKGNAASLKKFYSFLLEKGLIEKAELDEFAAEIKQEMPRWLAAVKAFDDELELSDW